MSDCKINLVSFVRRVEPRDPELDMLKPMLEQVKRLKAHNLPATFLLQYDAMLEDCYVNLFRDEPLFETGLWFEIVQPLVEAVGLPWRGRFPWDWHAHCGFSVGYTPEERILLIDELFRFFKERFGHYPTAVGSWMIDTFSLRYMVEKYHIRSSAICREQWGMDGYSLWGGYFSQGYYPSDQNVLCPAQTAEHRIDVPVFRKSNSCPIDDYDFDLDFDHRNSKFRIALTDMEPGCDHGGANPKFADWTFDINRAPYAQPFGFVDIGQENSFSWEMMENGINLLYPRCAELRDSGEADILTMSQMGDWYRENFTDTPTCCLYADKDSEGEKRGTLWYQSPFYRVNLMFDEQHFWIRDMHLFNETYQERYLSRKTTANSFCYDNLPVAEGRLWSDSTHRAGIYFCAQNTGMPLTGISEPDIVSLGDADKDVIWNTESGTVKMELRKNKMTVLSKPEIFMKNVYPKTGEEPVPFVGATPQSLLMEHNGFKYSLNLTKGTLRLNDDACYFYPDENGVMEFEF